MKISIITISLDSDEVLRSTVESVEQQTYKQVEHIVVDGCKNRGIIFNASKRVYHEPHGVYDAINRGLELATGDVIGLLHGGDRFAADTILQKVAEVFADNPSIDFIYGDIRYFSPATGKTVRSYPAGDFRPDRLQYGFAPPHPSLYIRREAARRIGPYRTDFAIAADLDMWMRLFADKSLRWIYLPEVFVEMSSNGKSLKLVNQLIFNNVEKLKALRLNGYSPNPFKLLLKYFYLFKK